MTRVSPNPPTSRQPLVRCHHESPLEQDSPSRLCSCKHHLSLPSAAFVFPLSPNSRTKRSSIQLESWILPRGPHLLTRSGSPAPEHDFHDFPLAFFQAGIKATWSFSLFSSKVRSRSPILKTKAGGPELQPSACQVCAPQERCGPHIFSGCGEFSQVAEFFLGKMQKEINREDLFF